MLAQKCIFVAAAAISAAILAPLAEVYLQLSVAASDQLESVHYIHTHTDQIFHEEYD